MLRLTGAMTAIITPFKNGAMDEDALRALVERQIEGGISALVPCGTTGEAVTLTDAERFEVIRITVEQGAGRVPIIAGTGTNDTRQSIELTRKARELGADATLAVCPPYNKPNQEGLFQHFSAIATAGLPVVLYNVPGRTVVSLTAETLGRLSHVEGIVAIKEATADLKLATEMMALAGDRMTFLSGDDFTTFPFVTIGGHGCISVVSNLDPALLAQLVEAGRRGDLEQGRAMHRKVVRLANLAFCDSNPAPIKWMLQELGLCDGALRLPLVAVDEARKARIHRGLVEEGYLPTP